MLIIGRHTNKTLNLNNLKQKIVTDLFSYIQIIHLLFIQSDNCDSSFWQ